mgnify:CR=1 FL=1
MSTVKLGDVAIESRDSLKEKDKSLPVVGLEHLIPEQIILTDWNIGQDNTFTKIFEKGDVLFGRRRAYLKKAAVAPCKGICSGDITVIRAKEVKILPELLPFVIQNDIFFDYAVGKSAGSLSPRVKWEHLANYEFNLPELEEQKKLAEVLWQIVDTMESYKKLLAKTDEMVKAKFVEMFGDPTKFKSEKLSKNVEEMFIGPFGSDLKNNCFVSKDEAYCIVYEQKHAISGTITDENRYITEKKYQQLKRFTLLPGDIIVSCRGTIGKIFLLPENAPLGIMHPSIMKIRLKKDTYNKKFFISLLRNKMDELINKADGTSVKMAITATKLGNIDFIIPNLTLQNKYVDLLDRAEESKAAIQASLGSLSAVYKKIIAENLGGK